ncbi:MAG: FAD-dependent oxidoreductase [Campylobacterales bacterium]|nr:FAD-dependent oxidoreductase [Campylobacterales bacterium]
MQHIGTDVLIIGGGPAAMVTAASASLKLARYGGIWVDEYMRTREKEIFAVGDCCGRRDFITRDPSKVMLASTSAAEARAQAEQIDSVSGTFTGINRHPGRIPGASKQSVKLIALRTSGQIIGGQVIGDREAGGSSTSSGWPSRRN